MRHHWIIGIAIVGVAALATACPRSSTSSPPSAKDVNSSDPARVEKGETTPAVPVPVPVPVEKTKTAPKVPAGERLALMSTKPRVVRKPNNVDSPIGTNIIPPSFIATEWAFIDSMKGAGWWTSTTVDKWGDGRSLDVDEAGWPKTLKPSQRATTIVSAQQGGPMVIRYRGKGEVDISGTTAPVDDLKQKPGRVTFVAKRNQHLIVGIVATDPKDPLRNLELFPADLEDEVDAGAIFHPKYLERLSYFKVIRYMAWQFTNSSPLVEWSQRTEPSSFTQALNSGVAFEYMVLLANTLKADPWFCLPHAATDAFVETFATFLMQELDPDLKIYIEYSNEVWHDHPEFSQALFARQHGEKLGLHQDNGIARLKYQARRSTEMMKIVERIIPADRLVRVLGSQIGNFYAHDGLISYGDTKEHTDAVAVAMYFGHEVGTNPGLLAAKNKGVILDFLDKYAIAGAIEATELSVNWGKKNDIAIIAYEGGQHLVAEPSVQNDERIGKLLDAANADPRMGKLYTRLLEGWKKAGGQMFVHFTFAAQPEKYGRFGALDSIDQPRKEAPKYDALLTFIEKNRPWWK